jgi:glyoxylase-like metal-dependent hydrolase (beta-lactamase superfamily II)
MRVAEGLERVHENVMNLYLVVDGGRVTVVDTGFPGNWGLLRAGLARLSRTLADVEVILLTHAHQDHVGLAERLRRESGAPVRIHEADLPYLLAGKRLPGKAAGGLSRPLLGYLMYAVRMGGFRMPPVAEAVTFEDGEILDVPGRPRVVHTPGHTDGHCSLHLAERGVLLAGDAIVTMSPTTGRRGPQLSPFCADLERARASLDRLERLPARLVLPGHGEPFAGTPAEAVALARAAEIR